MKKKFIFNHKANWINNSFYKIKKKMVKIITMQLIKTTKKTKQYLVFLS